MTAGMAKGAGC